MLNDPLYHIAGLASRQAARDDLAGSQIEKRLVIAVGGIQVRRGVIEEVDADHDPEEDRYDGYYHDLTRIFRPLHDLHRRQGAVFRLEITQLLAEIPTFWH